MKTAWEEAARKIKAVNRTLDGKNCSISRNIDADGNCILWTLMRESKPLYSFGLVEMENFALLALQDWMDNNENPKK